MISDLKTIDIPDWLVEIDSVSIQTNPFPLKDILKDSLYYPSSAFDGNPIKFLAGNFFSFIYVDYGLTQNELDENLNNRGFKGYEIVARRDLAEKDLAPNGWTPVQPKPEDGNPRKISDRAQKAFAEWVIFQRKSGFSEDHGPKRFSLVYLCADGTAAFQALYMSNTIAPKAVAIIRPGTGFGGNWTDFRNPELIFGRSVLGNPSGKPEYLLLGELECSSGRACWSGYDDLVWKQWTGHQHTSPWKNGGHCSGWIHEPSPL